jgi:hypothetical protein
MDLLSRDGWKIVPFSMKDEKNLDNEWKQFFIKSLEFDHTSHENSEIRNL